MTEEADLCIICYSELDCSGSATYSLPECGHNFHQNCIYIFLLSNTGVLTTLSK